MTPFAHLAGVYAAAVTPLKPDYSLDAAAIVPLLDFLAQRGCHGALLFGTTGEGPSFTAAERLEMLRCAVDIRAVHPEFHLLLGTGTPSLEETINLTREALEMGADGVVVLPPYYFRKVSDEGLFAWYSQLIQRGVPAGRALFGYHIPPVTGVPLSPELMRRLTDTYADRFAGVKDSSADLENARQIGAHFGSELVIFNGTDRLLTQALQAGATGCITALANLFSPELRRVWNAHQRGESDPAAQARLDAARAVMERYPPAPPLLKMLLARWHGYPDWTVRPPLLPLSREIADQAALDFEPLHND